MGGEHHKRAPNAFPIHIKICERIFFFNGGFFLRFSFLYTNIESVYKCVLPATNVDDKSIGAYYMLMQVIFSILCISANESCLCNI